MGPEPWSDRVSRMEAGARLHQVSLDRLQRSTDLVCAGSCFTHLSATRKELPGVVQDVQVEKTVRPRVCLRWSAVYPSTLAHVDRLPRYSRQVHAQKRY